MKKPVLAGLLALLTLLASALGAGTPADTEITNQASATYNDSSGEAQSTTSNQVVTIVQQVHEFTITPNGTTATPGQSKIVLSGAHAYFNYVVTNSGNATDTITLTPSPNDTDGFDFSSTTTFIDGNCNGTVDTGESSAGTLTLDADAAACVILAATTPPGQADGTFANIDLEGSYAGGSDTGNWARAAITEAAALDVRMSINPSGEVSIGDTLTVIVSGSNVGASAAYGVDASGYANGTTPAIVITQALPTDVTFAGNLTGTSGSGTLNEIYFNGTTWSVTEPTDLSTVEQVGVLLTGSDAFFAQTASFTFSFDATVDSGVTAGTVITHAAAEALYSTDGNDSNAATSNSASVRVGSSYGVTVGPFGDPLAASTGGSAMHGAWSISVPSTDTQRINVADTPVYTGSTILFKHTLQNTGNASDSFSLTVTGAPTAWTCSFRHPDGSTPISASVGPFPSTATFDFVVACAIPQANSNTEETMTTLNVTATSTSDAAVTDSTIDEVPDVLAGYAVDVTSRGATSIAGGPLSPDATLDVPFEVTNTGGNSDVYSLGVTLPGGWAATLHDDTNCDGNPEATVVTRTARLASGAQACFVASGSVPASAAPSETSTITLTAVSTTDPTVNDSVSGVYAVETMATISFNPDRSGTVTTPGTITYSLSVRNTGNTSATVDVPAITSTNGWTYQLSTDENTWSTSLSGVAVNPGSGTPVLIRVIVPAGQPVGRIEAATFTATGTFLQPDGATEASGTDTVTITSTVVGGDLTVTKSVRTCGDAACGSVLDASGATAEPDDYLEYNLVAKNIGTADLTEVIVMDPLPNYTTYVSANASTTAAFPDGTPAEVLYSSDGTRWVQDAGTLTLTAGDALYVAVNTDADDLLDVSDTDALEPGETITVTLTVQVQ